jgi:hypothetical protein
MRKSMQRPSRAGIVGGRQQALWQAKRRLVWVDQAKPDELGVSDKRHVPDAHYANFI